MQFLRFSLFCVDLDLFRPELGVADLLAAVKPVIARKHVAHTAGDGKVGHLPAPKSSTLRMMEAMGQFTAPQNTATMPTAAPKLAGTPSRPPMKQPKVAPMKNEGMISPPLKPQPG